MPTSLELLVLKTSQLGRLRQFYEALGCEFVEERHGNGPIHFAAKLGQVVLELYPLVNDTNPADTTTRLGYTVDNLTAVLTALDRIGSVVTNEPKESEWGLRTIVRDPDGRAIELCQRRQAG